MPDSKSPSLETKIEDKIEEAPLVKKPTELKKSSLGHYEKFVAIIAIMMAIPITIGLAMNRQNYLSHADSPQSDVLSDAAAATTRSKFIMGISLPDGLADKDANSSKIIAGLSAFAAPVSQGGVGHYPGSYTLWTNFSEDSNPDSPRATFPPAPVLTALDSKGISPAIYIQPVGPGINRADGKFKFSSSVDPSTIQSGQIMFDNANPSSVTRIYISKTGTALNASQGEYPNVVGLVKSWIPGSRFTIYSSTAAGAPNYLSSNHVTFSVASTADGGNYWIANVKPVSTSQVFKNGSIVWPSMSPTANAKQYSNESIISGSMDAYWRLWAQHAKAYGKPVLLRYAHEMNGGWFPWAPGQPTAKDRYGRYSYFNVNNNQANYVAAWRHIYNVVKPVAPNVKFYWCPYLVPDVTTTTKYYPGANYVDYVGFDAYQWNGSAGPSMNSLYSSSITNLRKIAPKIPMIIGETGIASVKGATTNNYRKSWISAGYQAIYNYSDVAGIIYFDFNLTQANWDLGGSPSVLTQYASIATDPRFQGTFSSVSKPASTPTPSRKPTPTPTKKPTSIPTPKPKNPPTAISSKQTTISVTADSFVSASEPTTSFGTSSILRVNGKGVASYLKFNLSALSGKTIEKVSLRTTTIGESDAGSLATAQVSSVSDNTWTETGLNNNNKPSVGALLGSFNPTKVSTNYSPDLAVTFFQNHVGGLASIAIEGSESDNMIFNSRESTSTKPVLVIIYH